MKTPARYIDAKYEDVPEDVRALVKEIRNTKKGIYLHGAVGTGKTHIAYAIGNKWQSVTQKYVTFWNTTELFNEIKEDFDRHYADKSRTLERLMDSDSLLILDDIGSEKPTEWVQEQFYLLINKKYNDMVPVIFTSNYTVAELAARLGKRIASRIVEMCDVKELKGVDRRLQK